MKCLNSEKREELGWRSPFEVYYGRKSNELIQDGKYANSDIDTVETRMPTSKEYEEQTKQTESWRNAAKKADDRMAKLMLDKHA